MLTAVPSTDTLPAHLPAGLRARRLDLGADREAVLDLVRAYDASHVQRPAQTPEDVVADLASSGTALARDAWLVTDGDQAVGLGWFAVEDSSPVRPLYWFDVYARPQLPVGTGLERALVEAMLDRAREELVASGAAEAVVESGCMRGDLRTDGALRDAGFAHERTFWRMERPLGRNEGVPAPPAGVVVRPARDEPADRGLLHRLFDAAFGEHWGTVRRSEDEWWQRLRGGVGFDPTQWWVAELDGEPVAFLIGDASRAPDGGGYVRYLGVLERARGRGIARHLLQVAFAEQAGRGWTWSQLTVDTDNTTGAPGLYASVGMNPVEVIDLYRRTLEQR
jgi:ribosomal protein S18 acetylase RimI-like enzyme